MEVKTMSSFTINRVVLVGRLTRDPELRALPSGVSVCGLRVACSSSRKDAGGEYREKPNYFNVSIYGAAADSIIRYIHKGSRVGIDGRLEWREWESADHQKRQSVSVVADTVQFLDSGSGGQRRESGSDGGFDADRGSGGEYDEYEEEGEAGELAGVGAGSGDMELVF
jgi:single-strand DNA-binding protein